jgi:ribose-phosphate pyrophosphokinase
MTISIDGHIIKPTIFPDNTAQIWKVPEELLTVNKIIVWDFTHEAEFLWLAQLRLLMPEDCSLYLPYLPYARQDKLVANDATFALHMFAKLLNTLEFSTVTICDPHSDIALSLINNSVAIYPTKVLVQVIRKTKATRICYPDNGAWVKYSQVYGAFDGFAVRGMKKRNQKTGAIEAYELEPTAHPIKGQSVLIIDDICDGGATFIKLAKCMYDAGAEDVHLFVTHGIFSKGIIPLYQAGIRSIYTADGEAVPDRSYPTTFAIKKYATAT